MTDLRQRGLVVSLCSARFGPRPAVELLVAALPRPFWSLCFRGPGRLRWRSSWSGRSLIGTEDDPARLSKSRTALRLDDVTAARLVEQMLVALAIDHVVAERTLDALAHRRTPDIWHCFVGQARFLR